MDEDRESTTDPELETPVGGIDEVVERQQQMGRDPMPARRREPGAAADEDLPERQS